MDIQQVLANLGIEEFFKNEGLPTVENLLQEICETSEQITLLRGKRKTEMKDQAEKRRSQSRPVTLWGD